MPGLRKLRAAVYFYSSTTTGGVTTARRTRQLSNDLDGLWWVSRGTPSGNEPTVGMKPEERLDAIICALAEMPVNRDSVIVIGDEQYRVLSVLPRDYGRDEHQMLCEVVPRDRYPLTEPT